MSVRTLRRSIPTEVTVRSPRTSGEQDGSRGRMSSSFSQRAGVPSREGTKGEAMGERHVVIYDAPSHIRDPESIPTGVNSGVG
jgi:hypothetical protein